MMYSYNLNFLIASTVFASLTLLGLFNILFLLRKKFPIKVNCWFCNTNLRVPYNDWNSFTCPKCQQYNGFNEDGSYNKEIPEQHYSKFNTNQFCQKTFVDRLSPSNGFCEFCSRNQELKVHQLANFRPRSESKYDEEIEEFRQKLEDSYQLCHLCQSHLNKTLNKVKTKFIGSKFSKLSSKINKSLHDTAKIIIDDGRVVSYFITTIILVLSIANFIRDMKVELPLLTNNERILNIYNHFRVFVYTVLDVINSSVKLSDVIENVDIDKIATSALILNALLIYNNLKKLKVTVIFSMLLWSMKMMINEIPIDASYELSVNGTMAIVLIISSIVLFKEKKRDELDMTNNTSFHKINTESFEESETETDYMSETSSFFDHRSNRTVFSKASKINSTTSFRTSMAEIPLKTLNSTLVQNMAKPIDISSNKSFSIRKEVLAADSNQVQNDITRLKLSDKNDEIFSTSTTIKEFNNSQYSNPFSLERSRCDSPAPSVVSMFSTSTRAQLISPPRLHSPLVYTANATPSWVAGGYWLSPTKSNMNQAKPMISRSSSQSSGLGTIDGSEKNSRDESQCEEVTSLFSDTTSHRRNLFEMPQNRSLFTKNTQFYNQPKSHQFFNSTYQGNNSFRNYRESHTFYK